MARNLALILEYEGTSYAGWQCQNHKRPHSGRKIKTIQDTIESVLGKILQEKIKLTGAGRTDAGVHAMAQVANFKTRSAIAPDKLRLALNCLLPSDITVTSVKEVASDFHSRFDAKSKIYRYSILNRSYPSAILRNTTFFSHHPLDLKLMRRQARALPGKHNFKSFRASDNVERDPVKTILKITIRREDDLIHIDIEADGFLRNMARNIAGTLMEIGKGKPIDMQRLISLRDRTKAGPTAPAKGLCLMKVEY